MKKALLLFAFSLVFFATGFCGVKIKPKTEMVKIENIKFKHHKMVAKIGKEKIVFTDPDKLLNGVMVSYQEVTITLIPATGKWVVTKFNCVC